MMHELAVTESILEIATQAAKERAANESHRYLSAARAALLNCG